MFTDTSPTPSLLLSLSLLFPLHSPSFLPPLPCSNSQVVEGADHATVVQLIRNSGREVNLVVVSVSEDEARKLEPDSSGGSMSAMDYFERRSVPVSIPDTRKAKDTGKEYVLFNIYLGNKLVASRRYREFDALHSNVSRAQCSACGVVKCICCSFQLKRQFGDFIFPKLPGKWPFQLNDGQVDTRRRSLEDYLDKGEASLSVSLSACLHTCPGQNVLLSVCFVRLVCSARVIFESDLMQDFLQSRGETFNSNSTSTKPSQPSPSQDRKVDLCIILPNRSKCTVSIKENSRTTEVFEVGLHLLCFLSLL